MSGCHSISLQLRHSLFLVLGTITPLRWAELCPLGRNDHQARDKTGVGRDKSKYLAMKKKRWKSQHCIRNCWRRVLRKHLYTSNCGDDSIITIPYDCKGSCNLHSAGVLSVGKPTNDPEMQTSLAYRIYYNNTQDLSSWWGYTCQYKLCILLKISRPYFRFTGFGQLSFWYTWYNKEFTFQKSVVTSNGVGI